MSITYRLLCWMGGQSRIQILRGETRKFIRTAKKTTSRQMKGFYCDNIQNTLCEDVRLHNELNTRTRNDHSFLIIYVYFRRLNQRLIFFCFPVHSFYTHGHDAPNDLRMCRCFRIISILIKKEPHGRNHMAIN